LKNFPKILNKCKLKIKGSFKKRLTFGNQSSILKGGLRIFLLITGRSKFGKQEKQTSYFL